MNLHISGDQAPHVCALHTHPATTQRHTPGCARDTQHTSCATLHAYPDTSEPHAMQVIPRARVTSAASSAPRDVIQQPPRHAPAQHVMQRTS
eukprot:1851255-Rhodomonas_salina.2